MTPRRPEHWTKIRVSAADAEREKEKRLRQAYSLHLEVGEHPDRAIIYWRADDDGGRTYFFSPEAAKIAGQVLQQFSPRSVVKPEMRDLQRLGAAIANWRHSYVNLR
jgi:hypothetical protein